MNIRHWLLPSRKNKFHPHVLRPVGLTLFLLIFLAIPPLYNATTASKMQVLGYASNISVSDIQALSNQERANNGLPALAFDSQLTAAAQAKARDMITKNYWAHNAPDGTTPWAFITAAGYNYAAAGENLAKNFDSSSGVVAGWMASPAHRANVLGLNYSDIGIATLDGVLQGSETTLVVAMYGTRANASPPAPAAPAAPSAPVAPAAKTTETPATPAPQTPSTTDTKAPTETQQETPTSKQTQTNTPATENNTTVTGGEVEGASTILPVRVYNSLNWGQKASLVLISTLMLLFVMKHTIVWRQQKRGLQHIWLRSHPLSQVAALAIVFVVTILSSVGTIL